MIFSCIRLDFQIFMDPEEEKAVVMEQRPDVRLEDAADASLFGQGDRANRSSMRPQTIWRSEEGFWDRRARLRESRCVTTEASWQRR